MKWVRVAAEVNPEVTEISTVALVCEERCLSWIWVMIRMDLAFFVALLSQFLSRMVVSSRFWNVTWNRELHVQMLIFQSSIIWG